MKTKQRALLTLSAFLLVSSPLVPLLPVSEVQAVADTFTLTKVGDDRISVVLNGTPQVQLPNGVIVTTNTTFTVKENKTYTFVGIDGAVKVQKPIVMTTVPNTAPLLMVSPKENVFLNFESGDPHSGVKDMRYVAYDEAVGQGTKAYSAWESFKAKKAWTVPTINNQTSATWVVKAEYRDVAGNIASNVIGRFFIDNEAPLISLNKTVTYTNQRDMDVIASISSKFADPETGYLSTSATGTYTPYKLSDQPNLFTGTNVGQEKNFEYSLPYQLPVAEGIYNLWFKADKRQNNILLESSPVQKSVMYDKTAPTGTVVIDDGSSVIGSNQVKLTIKTADNLSGVEKIRIVEESASGSVKEQEILNPPATVVVDWNLYIDDEAQVSVIIYDKAGNSRIIESQVVTFAQMTITGFQMTNNRNPTLYYPGNPFQTKTWDWVGEDEKMLAGSTFDFRIYYDLGLGQPVDYNVTGTYTVEFKTGTVSHHKATIPYDPAKAIANGLSAENVEIPLTVPPGARVFVSSDLKAVRKMNTNIVSTDQFPPAFIGVVDKTLEEAVNGTIEFNEIN